MNHIYIWHDGRYRFHVLLRKIPVQGLDLDLELSYKSQTFFTLNFTQLIFGMVVDIGFMFYSEKFLSRGLTLT